VSDELPDIFRQLRPRPAPAALRPRVLDAVERTLARSTKPRWERAFELAAAACLMLGVGLNVWCWRTEEPWQLRVYGPSPIPGTIVAVAQSVAAATDRQTGERVKEQLAAAWLARRRMTALQSWHYERIFSDRTISQIGPTL